MAPQELVDKLKALGISERSAQFALSVSHPSLLHRTHRATDEHHRAKPMCTQVRHIYPRRPRPNPKMHKGNNGSHSAKQKCIALLVSRAPVHTHSRRPRAHDDCRNGWHTPGTHADSGPAVCARSPGSCAVAPECPAAQLPSASQLWTAKIRSSQQ